MRNCKSCGKDISVLEMPEEICMNCRDLAEKAKQNIEESDKTSVETKSVGFWKHASNWKYYIIPLIVGVLVAYDFSETGREAISKVNIINTIVALIFAFQFKEKFLSRLAMFIVAGVISGIIMVLTYTSSIYIFEKINGNNGKRQKIILNMLNTNSKLPVMVNDELQIVKYSSTNSKTITMHGKFINYTKNEILEDYSNKITEFENDMLKQELETSCLDSNGQKLFSLGIDMNIEYLDKNNNIVGKVSLNAKKCKPYYKITNNK